MTYMLLKISPASHGYDSTIDQNVLADMLNVTVYSVYSVIENPIKNTRRSGSRETSQYVYHYCAF